MRGPIIILALVALSFVAVLVYGVGRDRPESSFPVGSQSGAPSPTKSGQSIDKDALENWRPPDLLSAFKGMASGYTKGLKMVPEQVTLPGEKQTVQATVNYLRKGEKLKFKLSGDKDEDNKKIMQNPRTVKLTLTSGVMAVITAQTPDEPQQLCLCQPGAGLSLDDLKMCKSEAWQKRQKGNICRLPDKRQNERTNTLAIYAPGAALTFTSFRPATVSSK